jgi:[protein release factor]-glutamine N5-methyltransferase (EC 2.1.1.-)
MRVVDALSDASARLAEALRLDRTVARLEARVLAVHAWDVAPSWLLAHDTDPLAASQSQIYQTLVEQRLRGIPIAYLTGTREFYGREFEVTLAVLIPRPETERLVELALARLPIDAACEVLDLGTGSGCVAITLALERPQARVTAVDNSTEALQVAQRNAARLGARVEFVQSDWFAALDARRFDLIVGNPPYVAATDPHLQIGDLRFEPMLALASGYDGLDGCKRIVAAARAHLRPGGGLLLEHGYDQGAAMRELLRREAYHSPSTWQDLAGIERVSGGTLSD